MSSELQTSPKYEYFLIIEHYSTLHGILHTSQPSFRYFISSEYLGLRAGIPILIVFSNQPARGSMSFDLFIVFAGREKQLRMGRGR